MLKNIYNSRSFKTIYPPISTSLSLLSEQAYIQMTYIYIKDTTGEWLFSIILRRFSEAISSIPPF